MRADRQCVRLSYQRDRLTGEVIGGGRLDGLAFFASIAA
jgi:hypothetical protein